MQMADQLGQMNADELREFAARLITEIADNRREISLKQLKIDQLTHEMAILKRWKFAARSEQLHGEQRHLFDETLEADLEAIGLELAALKRVEDKKQPKDQARRAPLPANLPRTEVRHEPESTVCACGTRGIDTRARPDSPSTNERRRMTISFRTISRASMRDGRPELNAANSASCAVTSVSRNRLDAPHECGPRRETQNRIGSIRGLAANAIESARPVQRPEGQDEHDHRNQQDADDTLHDPEMWRIDRDEPLGNGTGHDQDQANKPAQHHAPCQMPGLAPAPIRQRQN